MINIILLAAGDSSRLGEPKQLLPFKGSSLLRHAVHTALDSQSDNVIVVTGAFKNEIVEEIEDLNCEIIINEEWESGMGNSLKKGISFCLDKFPETEAVITMTCDQPFLTADILDSLISSYKNGEDLVCAKYENDFGVPALFDRQYFDELLEINDKEGAKKIVKSYTVSYVQFPRGGIDIDTTDDLKHLT